MSSTCVAIDWRKGGVYRLHILQLSPAIIIASGEELLVETWDPYMGVWGADEPSTVMEPATGRGMAPSRMWSSYLWA
jgi:hypothetical protein